MTEPKFYVLTDEDLAKVERVMRRLHSEDRLDGDSMRNLGHELEVVSRNARGWEVDPKEVRR